MKKINLLLIVTIISLSFLCFGCSFKFDLPDIPKQGHKHKLEFHDKIEATCQFEGYRQYYKCTECKTMFSDKKKTTTLDYDAIRIDKISHNYQGGYCTSCGKDESYNDPYENSSYDFAYNLKIDGTLTITRCFGGATNITIPFMIDGYEVNEIRSISNDNIKALFIPSTITTIGGFYCINLTTISYGGTIEMWNNINKSDEWTSETNLVNIHCLDGDIIQEHKLHHISGYPETCTSSGMKDHYFCEICQMSFFDKDGKHPATWNDIYIEPSGHKFVGESCINCDMKIKDNILYKLKEDGTYIFMGVFPEKNSNFTITIPDLINGVKITEIGSNPNWSHKQTPVEKIIIGKYVTKISDRAFYNLSDLKEIVIPSRVTKIEGSAFLWCDSLTSITYSGTIEMWNAIEKGTEGVISWYFETPLTVIHCIDGDINLE